MSISPEQAPINCKKLSILAVTIAGFLGLLITSVVRSEIDETALYEIAPQDAAFVRTINLTHRQLVVEISSKTMEVDKYCSASDFMFLSSGNHSWRRDGVRHELTVDAGRAYSLVVSEGDVKLIGEPNISDSGRGVLAAYNFSNYSTLDVKTEKFGKLVFSKVPKDGLKHRKVNPVKISLLSFSGPYKVDKSVENVFQPGVLSSLFLCADGDSVISHWANY